jgi:transposase
MHKTVKKTLDFKEGITLPEVVLPTVLPTDTVSLVALLHSVVASHRSANEMLHGYLNQAQVWVAESKAQVAQAQGRVDRLLEQIVLTRRHMFGTSSEQSDGQGHLFNEAEALALGSTEEQDLAVIPVVKDSTAPKIPADRNPPRGKRAPLPSELEHVEVFTTCPSQSAFVPVAQRW